MDYTENNERGEALIRPSQENEALGKKFRQELVISGYSARTVKMYLCYFKEFAQYLKKNVQEAERDDIVGFLAEKKEKKNASNATLALAHAALHFFYHNVLGKKIVDDVKIAKKAKKIPVVLTKEEVRSLIKATGTRRDRLIVEFLYSSGCRVSECVKLQTENMNFKERIASIRGGKGNKDRTIILSKDWLKKIKVERANTGDSRRGTGGVVNPNNPYELLLPGGTSAYRNASSEDLYGESHKDFMERLRTGRRFGETQEQLAERLKPKPVQDTGWRFGEP